MKRIIPSSIVLLLRMATGCSIENTVPPAETCLAVNCAFGASCDPATGQCVNPPMPSLATAPLIDRMGRPGVNTALTNPFDLFPFGNNPELSDKTKNDYNKDLANAATNWANWAPAIGLHLAIFDRLDDTCANQAAYGALTVPDYGLLSLVLAGDALQVDTRKTACNQYLGAELSFLGAPVDDCGGRSLRQDVIDVTYAALAGTGRIVTDAISESTTPLDSFPFMTSPK